MNFNWFDTQQAHAFKTLTSWWMMDECLVMVSYLCHKLSQRLININNSINSFKHIVCGLDLISSSQSFIWQNCHQIQKHSVQKFWYYSMLQLEINCPKVLIQFVECVVNLTKKNFSDQISTEKVLEFAIWYL